jgi:phage internal scaffolding protein
MALKIRKPYTRLSVGIVFKDKSRTRQSEKDATDINLIVDKYQKTGVLSFAKEHAGQYGEVQPYDLQQAYEMIQNAEGMFTSLPSSVRKMMDNDPLKFMEFVSDPSNAEKMYELGLAERPIPEYQPDTDKPDVPPPTEPGQVSPPAE